MIWIKIESYSQDWENIEWPPVRDLLRRLTEDTEITDEKPDRFPYNLTYKRHRVTFEEADQLARLGVKIQLAPLEGTMLTKMEDRAEWNGREIEPEDLKTGTAVNITVADNHLVRVDEVTWVDDACTQEIQGLLDEGWRILAVCPPNAQRRPDYILGRRKADFA